MLVARLLATSAFWVRIQMSHKNTKWATRKGVANTLYPAKKTIKNTLYIFTLALAIMHENCN
jgi:hypothetical protein